MTLPQIYNPLGCGACVHFQACQRDKHVKATTEYCQYREGSRRFQRARALSQGERITA